MLLFSCHFLLTSVKYIEDIYFFEVNTKYISLSEMKTSEISRVRSKSENPDVSTHKMKYILYSSQKSKFSFHFILFIGYM